MGQRIVAISGSCPDYQPRVSRPLKPRETFPLQEGSRFFVEELLTDVCILEISNNRAMFFWPTAEVEQLRDQHNWEQEANP